MRSTGGFLALFFGLAAFGAAVWWLMRPATAEAVAPRPPFVLPVTTVTLATGTLRPEVALTGTVRAARRAALAFEVAGTVRELHAEEAGTVTEGSVLARLDARDEELELASARASLELARRELDLSVAGERPEEVRRLAAVLAAARAEEALARSEVERGEKLLADRVLSQSEQDRRMAELSVAEKRRVAVEEEHARALAGTRAEDLAIARARVDQAEARAASAAHALEKTRLLAPWSGTVVRREVSSGDYVSSGTAVFELVDLEHLEVHVDVPGRVAAELGARPRARLARPGGTALETEIDALVPAADEAARSFRAIVRLEGDERGELKPGMFLDVVVLLTPLEGALLAPSDAVLASEQGSYVVRAAPAEGGQGQVAEFVPVRVLARHAGQAALEALVAPLAAGDTLVLTGADNAFPGASLAARPAEGGSVPR